jgi:hypothetical protein
MNDEMAHNRDQRARMRGSARPGPPLWLHGLRTVGWGFLCLHAVAISFLLDAPPAMDTLLLCVAILGAPLVVVSRGLLYSRSRVRWWWVAPAVVAGIATFVAALWLWMWSGRARLQNTLYLIAPVTYVISWSCVGLLVVSIFDGLWIHRYASRRAIAAIGGLAGGAYGVLHMLVPQVPGPSDYGPFLLSPGIVLETASCYGLVWLGRCGHGRSNVSQESRVPSRRR